MIAEFADWSVRIVPAIGPLGQSCRLISRQGSREFGVVYTTKVLTLIASDDNWNLSEADGNLSVGFSVEDSEPFVTPVYVIGNALVADFSKDKVMSLALIRPFFAGLEYNISIVFPGAAGKWTYGYETPRNLAGEFDKCIEALKNAEAGSGQAPF